MPNRNFARGALVVGVVALVGCADENERIADYAMENARRQAEQNQTLIETNRSIAEGSRGLVTADAASRRELATLQRELRADQAQISQQYEELAQAHTHWVENHERDAQAGSAIVGLALVIACLAPLLLAGLALFGQHDPPTAEEVDATLRDQ